MTLAGRRALRQTVRNKQAADAALRLKKKGPSYKPKPPVVAQEMVGWREVADLETIEEFLDKTKGYNAAQKGVAFELWIIRKMARNQLDRGVTLSAALLKEIDPGLAIKTTRRIPDRYRILSGTLWDQKHYLPTSLVDLEQLQDYVHILNSEATGAGRLCYIFSRPDAAASNLRHIAEALQEGGLKRGRSVRVFYVDPATSRIRCLDVKDFPDLAGLTNPVLGTAP